MAEALGTGFSRVFLIEDRASPTHVPIYEGQWRAGALSWGQGDITLIYEPSTTQYDSFNVVSKIKGQPDNPTLAVVARYSTDLSALLRLTKKGCENDLHVHFGQCQDPRDFNGGWDKVLIFEAASVTDYGTDELGALSPDERAIVNENVTFTGSNVDEVKRIKFAKKAESNIVQEVVDVHVCDAATCGACGIASDGCQVVLVLTISVGASPGLPAEIVYTQDGGATWLDSNISTLGLAEDPSAFTCVGNYVVVISNGSNSVHYMLLAELLDGTGSWAEITTGFEAGGEPNDIFSLGPTFTWIVGDGGYIYFSDDPTNGVTVQDAGSATTQDLLDVHGINELELIAVGKSNAVVHTADGGETWESITGPAVGVQLNTCQMVTNLIWWVGANNGKLYYTTNGGTTWAEKTFPGSGAGSVKDLKFASRNVGYLAHTTAAPAGRILRTINGGYSWYVAPEGTSTIPTNQGINALAVCEDVNVVFGGGVTVVNGDGIVVASS